MPLRIQDAGVAIDLATHDLDIMQYVLGRDISSIYAEGAPLPHPTQEDMITCLLRFGDDGPRACSTSTGSRPEKRREIAVIGEDGHAARLLHHPGRLVHRVADRAAAWDELARMRGDAEGAAVRFALRQRRAAAGRARGLRRCVLDDTPEPVSAHDGCRALSPRRWRCASRPPTRRPVTLLDMPSPAPLAVAAWR